MADGDGMKLDADARQRLRDSIAHWERIAANTRRQNETIFSENCPLCDRFLNLHCIDCPVESCRKGSPWYSVADANKLHGKNSPEFFAAARAMLAFLRQLDAELEDAPEDVPENAPEIPYDTSAGKPS
jgi:hypothetical protein